MATGVWTGSLATPYRVNKADSSENQMAQKSVVPLALVGALDTAETALANAYIQVSSTFDIANDPAMAIKLLWTYGGAATLLSVRFKVSMDLSLDSFDWAESVGSPSSGTSVVDILTLTFAKATWDLGGGVAKCPVSILEPRRRYVQVWAKTDSATTGSMLGYVGGGTHG